MKLSVIILNYNVKYFLELCLRSVEAAISNIDAEIIVVDNNSEDFSGHMIKALFPEVRLIENKENYGFSKGNNIGVLQAKGDYLCILNPDTVVSEDTFAKVFAMYEAISTKVGIIGCKLIDGTGISCQKASVEFRLLGWLLQRFLDYIKFRIISENITPNIYLKTNQGKSIF